jgi:hypothetical protein
MVMKIVLCASGFSRLLADQSTVPVLEQLDPPRRAAVLMALLGLVLLGLALVTCAMIGAHWVRRMARHKPGAVRAKAAAAAVHNARLRDALASVLPDAKTDDTIQLGRSPRDTKMDL